MVQDQSCDTPKWGHVYLASSPPGRKKWVYRLLPAEQESYDKSRWHIKKQRHHFANKRPYRQSYGFSSTHVQMWELDHKEGQAPKSGCFRTVVLEKTLESPLDSKEIKPVNTKGNQPWIFIGAEAKAPILWPPDAKSVFTGKDLDAGKAWGQEEKGVTRRWDGWMASLIQWTWIWAISEREWGTGKPGILLWGCNELDVTAWLSDWTTTNPFIINSSINSSFYVNLWQTTLLASPWITALLW